MRFARPAGMTLQLTELSSDVEFHELMAVLYDAYSNPYNGFWNIFKGRYGEECTNRYTGWHNADPTSHWIYVTDRRRGELLGEHN